MNWIFRLFQETKKKKKKELCLPVPSCFYYFFREGTHTQQCSRVTLESALRNYSWSGFRGPYEMLGSNPSRPHARQTSYPLSYCSTPALCSSFFFHFFFLEGFGFGVIPDGAQGIFLTLCSGITPVGAWGTI